MPLDLDAAIRQLDQLPDLYEGPGGVAGLVHEGKVVAMRAWGHADIAARRPLTTESRLPICSISKQFTCACAMEHLDIDAHAAEIADWLPALETQQPTMRQLMNNQSGLRDYWAMAVLMGAQPDGEFRRSDAKAVISRMQRGHFTPGTSYSYCNPNFRILGEILEAHTGRSLEDLYQDTIFGPAGMHTAVLAPETAYPLDGVLGYEGNPDTGYFPAVNRMYWRADTGIAASITDMLAWECFIDATRDDEDGLYRRISAAPEFSDGAPAAYGGGLVHAEVAGRKATGHGGALRGIRAHRWHIASERLSAVVMFNHEANAQAAAAGLLEAALGASAFTPDRTGMITGDWVDPESGLLIRLSPELRGQRLDFGTGPDMLQPAENGAEAPGIGIALEDGKLRMTRRGENLNLLAEPVLPRPDTRQGPELAGRYHCAEFDCTLEITDRDGATHAVASGHFGIGPAERLNPVGADLWRMPVRRSVDAPAPGNWTVHVERDAEGRISGLKIGCWLARDLKYCRIG